MSVDTAGGHHPGQKRPGDAEPLHDLLIPHKPVDVEQHGAGGIGIVGHMDRALCQVPDQPGVHRSEHQFSPLGTLPCPGHIVQDPGNLGGAEIGIRHQAGLFPNLFVEPVLLQRLDHVRSAAALPHDRVVYGLACVPVPEKRGLPLVGDADGGYLPCGHPGHGHALRGHRQLGRPDFLGVVLHPARLGVNLCKFLLGHTADSSRSIEQNTTGTGSPLIQCHHVFLHMLLSLLPERGISLFILAAAKNCRERSPSLRQAPGRVCRHRGSVHGS